MAIGTGNLPNKSMSFTPFDILTAEEQNDLVENIESLATGTGIGDAAITTAKIATKAVKADKIDFETIELYSESVNFTLPSSAGVAHTFTFTAPKACTVLVELSIGRSAVNSATTGLDVAFRPSLTKNSNGTSPFATADLISAGGSSWANDNLGSAVLRGKTTAAAGSNTLRVYSVRLGTSVKTCAVTGFLTVRIIG